MLSTICEGAENTSRENQALVSDVVLQRGAPTYTYVTGTTQKVGDTPSQPSELIESRKYSQCLDDYEDLGEIGRGQFGSVHKIRLKSAPLVVLVWKKLDYQRMPEKEKKQLQQEVQLLQTLEHPHVVRYLGKINDKTSSNIYILMEYCDGGDLSKYLDHTVRKGFPLPEDTILLWFSQLVDALHYCHTLPSGRVFHRDIKPQNVLICEKYKKVKLGDFGLAKMLKPQQNMANTHVGTPYYMSPEVLNRSQYDAKSDIWSLGCLLFEMATGRSPHCKATTLDHLKALVEGGHIEKLPSMFSKELYSLILWMLTKNLPSDLQPSSRPSTSDLRGTLAFRLGCFVGLGELTAKVETRRRALDKENKQLKAALEREQDIRRKDQKEYEEKIRGLKSELAQYRESKMRRSTFQSKSDQNAMEETQINPSTKAATHWITRRLGSLPLRGFGGHSMSTATGGESSVPVSDKETSSPQLSRHLASHSLLARWEKMAQPIGQYASESLWQDKRQCPLSQTACNRLSSHCGSRSDSFRTDGKSSHSARERSGACLRKPSLTRFTTPTMEIPKRSVMLTKRFRPHIHPPPPPSKVSGFSETETRAYITSQTRHPTTAPSSPRSSSPERFIDPQHSFAAPRRSPFSTPLRRAELFVEKLPVRLSVPRQRDDVASGWKCTGSTEKRLKSAASYQSLSMSRREAFPC